MSQFANPKDKPQTLICRVCDTEIEKGKNFIYFDAIKAKSVVIVEDRKTGLTVQPNCHQCGYSYNLTDKQVADAREFERQIQQLENDLLNQKP